MLRDGLEPSLVECQRRAMVETISAIIAREVNTPLDCASVALHHALAHAQGASTRAVDPVLRRELELALESVSLARAVLRDTIQLAGPSETVGTTDLSRDVGAMLALTTVMKPAHLVVEPDLEPSLRVVGAPALVQQIVLNLLIAAFRSLEDQDPREESRVRVTTSRSGLGGRLVVEDNGPGIPSRLRSGCFDPFAAPRGAGQWNGLGLHAVKRISLMLGGRVEFNSDHGRGTVVAVELLASA